MRPILSTRLIFCDHNNSYHTYIRLVLLLIHSGVIKENKLGNVFDFFEVGKLFHLLFTRLTKSNLLKKFFKFIFQHLYNKLQEFLGKCYYHVGRAVWPDSCASIFGFKIHRISGNQIITISIF